MADKDRALLDDSVSPTRTDSITERIARLKREIARGEAVYSPEELKRLERMLEEYTLPAGKSYPITHRQRRNCMSNNKQEITFKYIFTYDYNPVFINGAHGGVTPRGELVVNFYQERAPLPNSVTHELNPNGTIGSELTVEPEDLNRSLVRFVSTGIVVTQQTARELHYWLGEKIKELDALEQAKAAAFTSAQMEAAKGSSH